MWYDIGQTLTYNCLFNFVIGNRGCGKTYAAKKRAIKLFIDKGHQFVYLRRFKDELDQTAESYFNDIIENEEFPNTIIEYKNGQYFVNDQLAGYAMALTKAKDIKSASFPLVYFIIFDEFLMEDNGYTRYLKNEVEQFLSFYMSIDRYRGCTVFFLANSVALINPYTLYFRLQLPHGSNITRKGDVLLQLVQDEEYINERKQTRFGKIIEGTDFAKYAIENKFRDDDKTFILPKTEKAQHKFSFIYNGDRFGVWLDFDEGKYFVSVDYDPSCPFLYAITTEDHSPNTMLLSKLAKTIYFRSFIDAYKNGNVYFENVKTKNIAFEVIRLCVK